MPITSDYEKKAFAALEAKQRFYENQIAYILKQALDDIRVEMSKAYEKYANNGVLTKAEMTKYARLTALEARLSAIVIPATNQVQGILKRIPPAMYGEAFFRYAWTVEQAIQAAVSWGTLNKEQVLANLDNPIDKIAIQKYKATAPYAARTALNNGLIKGQSFSEMMKDMRRFVDATNFEAIRILRTEARTAIGAGQTASYTRAKSQGIDGGVIWDSSLDGRTRSTHGAADGQIRDDKGEFTIGGEKALYPGYAGLSAAERINCRCRLHFEITGWSPTIRRSRDQGLIPYQTYDTWSKGVRMWA